MVVVEAVVLICVSASGASVRLVVGTIIFLIKCIPCEVGVISTSSLDVISLLGPMHILDGPIMRGGTLAASVDLGSLVVSGVL